MPSSSSLIRFSDRKSEQSLVKNRNPNALEIHACKCRNLFFKASIQFLFSISKNCPMMNFTCIQFQKFRILLCSHQSEPSFQTMFATSQSNKTNIQNICETQANRSFIVSSVSSRKW